MIKQLVYVLGDIHGDFGKVNTFINKEIRANKKIRALAGDMQEKGAQLEIVFLQCGDFGFCWPGEDNSTAIKNAVDFLADGHVKIFWVDGNHENHDALDALERQHPGEACIEVAPYVFFATFGATLTLADGTNVLFAGGAESWDFSERKAGLSWWAQEGIDDRDMARLPGIPTRIDWVISHTGPTSFIHDGSYSSPKKDEQSRQRLEAVRAMFTPKRWFFGHFHDYAAGNFEGCAWACLNYLGSGDIWYESFEIAPSKRRILIAGDVHGSFSDFGRVLSVHSPELVLQCGDFGFWPNQGMRLPKSGFLNAVQENIEVRWCDGNHENHPLLIDMVANNRLEICPGTLYQPRGSTLPLPDGRVVMFVGGANSIDQHSRTRGVDWFPQEVLTDEDFETFPDTQVDIVIAHTLPEGVPLHSRLDQTWHDPSRAVLQRVWKKYHPSLWFCGHFHIPWQVRVKECLFVALNVATQKGGAVFLDAFDELPHGQEK